MQKLVFQKLTELDIKHTTYFHKPLFTCEQAAQAASLIPAAQCKNLFLKDSKQSFYLIVAVAETVINLKQLSKYLQAPELRFANAELLHQHLHVTPGSVTPFGLIFNKEHTVTVLLDSTLFAHEYVGFHPLENTATTVITPHDLVIFLDSGRHNYKILNFKEIIDQHHTF
jgi:Ala-tRNA(Pro) deacylase